MAQLRPAVHRTILVVDVEGFGGRSRTNPDQVAVRDGMYKALHRTFRSIGIRWADCHREDRGDGVFILAPPEIPKGLFSESLPYELAAAPREHNEAHDPDQRIRLRMALHAGEINYDSHGVTGAALNLAYRLLDAGLLKDTLAASPGVLALIASSWFFGEVVRHSAASNPDTYRPVLVDVKETSTVGWIALPDHPFPHDRSHPDEAWRVRVRDPSGLAHGGGVLVCGRYVVTAARVIAQSLGLASDAPCPAGQVLCRLNSG